MLKLDVPKVQLVMKESEKELQTLNCNMKMFSFVEFIERHGKKVFLHSLKLIIKGVNVATRFKYNDIEEQEICIFMWVFAASISKEQSSANQGHDSTIVDEVSSTRLSPKPSRS